VQTGLNLMLLVSVCPFIIGSNFDILMARFFTLTAAHPLPGDWRGLFMSPKKIEAGA